MFEAPTRVADLVSRLSALVPDREAVLCRELSKRHEEVRRGPLIRLADDLGARDRIRGECVVVVGPGETPPQAVVEVSSESMRSIATALAGRWGVKRKDVYNQLLAVERELNPRV